MNIHKIPSRDVKKKLAALEGQDIHDLSGWDVRKRVLDRHANGRELTGIKLPWEKTHDKVRLRPGEVSVWAGFNAHRKSTVLSQVAAWASREVKVGMASLEMPLEETAYIMAMQAAGTAQPDTRWVNDFCTYSENRIFIYDRLDTVPTDQVYSAIDYMAEDLGCGLIVIDSLMMCGVADDMDRERAFMHTLTGLAKLYKTHIAVAHHMRKPQHGDESYVPNKFDLRGSGGISDLAHSVFICWHNKKRKELKLKVDNGVTLNADERVRYDKEIDRPDQLVIVAKQRNGEFEGGTALWQHPSRQFCETSRLMATHLRIPRLDERATA